MSDSPVSFFNSPEIPGLSPEEYAGIAEKQIDSLTPGRTFEPGADASPLARALLQRRENDAARKYLAVAEAESDAFVERARERGIAVAGAGLMGISIAASFVNSGFDVLLYDPFEGARESAHERLERELAALRSRSGRGENFDSCASESEERARIAELARRRCRTTGDIPEIAARPVVVESIPEKVKLKAKFYRELNASAPEPVLLLTNTSSLRIDELAAGLNGKDEPGAMVAKERFAGFHFFHPASKRAIVEIASGAFVDGETLRRAASLAVAIGKSPVLAGDSPGFIVNRLLQAVLNESLAMLDEGVPAARIEEIALQIGMEAPPLRIIDEIGIDVTLRSGWSFLKAFPSRTHASVALEELMREGRLGRKSGRGFYRFGSGTPWAVDAELDFGAFEAGSGGAEISSASDEELGTRIGIALFFEALRLVEEGVACSLFECDSALCLALGFPRSKGGIAYWALASGVAALVEEAKKWSFLGDRFDPPALVREFL